MADTTLQETLLNRIPVDLQEQISAAPSDIYEKVHQRELLMIEQIKHFANIRVEELANFGRNLLEQRKYENNLREKESAVSDKPALKSIVKRVPSKMEKRVSFSELPPEIEEFYSGEGDNDTSEDEFEDRQRHELEADEDDASIASDSDSNDIYFDSAAAAPTLGDSLDSLDALNTPSEVPSTPSESGPKAPVPLSPDLSPSSSQIMEPPSPDKPQYTYSASAAEPVISFDDAYGYSSEEVVELSEEEIPVEVHTPSPPPSQRKFVGSAPINIDVDGLVQEHQAKIAGTPDLSMPLNPENMSFSQRMAWEERPQH